MTTLAIRDFPEKLLKALKVRAAQEGKTLKEVCIELLTDGTRDKRGKK
jgi:plasmid stability protein